MMKKKERLTFDIDADEIDLFLQDTGELLQTIEDGVLRLERAADAETLHAIFRAAHTLKAMAGTVGHGRMSELTNALETLFDAMREGVLSPTPCMTDDLLSAVDALKALRDEVVACEPSGVDVDALLARLRALSEEPSPRVETPGEKRRLTPEQVEQVKTLSAQGRVILEVEAVVAAGAFAPAARLLQAAMSLAELGQVIAQFPSQEDLIHNEHAGRLWAILAADADISAVENRLGLVFDLAECNVRPYAVEAVPSMPPAMIPISESVGSDKTVRIHVERLDALMGLVGELVTARTRLTQLEARLRARLDKREAEDLDETTTRLGRVVDQLQEQVMRARMMPVSQLFDKFPRVVRDLARAAGKQVNLILAGRATELDRSIIEAIGDPLVHLLRNAVDHGIELPEERIAAGKPAVGTIWLTAAHEEGQVTITVRDDGRGVDLEKVRQAAVRRRLFTEEEASCLSREEVLELIFLPHLSTSDRVTDLSGRGVGLDVVRAHVQRIGGSVMVESEPGSGATFRLTLPLTLAIVQAMLVGVGEDVYAVPMTSILDSLYMADAQVDRVRAAPVIRWRGTVLPILSLRQFFAHPRLAAPNGGKPAVVTVAWGRLRLGLVVDRIIGEQEVVVKAFSPIMGRVPGLAGCSILGDGRIALIIDVPGLIHAAVQARREEAL